MKLLVLILFCIFSLLYATPTKKNIKKVSKDYSGLYGDKFQGDIQLTPKQEKALRNENGQFTGTIIDIKRWEKVGHYVEVPYIIDNTYSQENVNIIIDAMNEIQSKTCIRFIENTGNNIYRDYLNIMNSVGCWSGLGKSIGVQNVSLSTPPEMNCMENVIIVHELIHALGFTHMQNDQRRDNFIKIHFENLPKTNITEQNFSINGNDYGDYGTNYDYLSIMHYQDDAFSENNKTTIETLDPRYQKLIGRGTGMSRCDILRINRMYECVNYTFDPYCDY